MIRVVQLETHSGRQAAGGEGDQETRHRGQGEGARRGRADNRKVVGNVDKCPFKMLVSVVAARGLGDGNLGEDFNRKNI